jgi:membrane fusion protein (multidrug efflux system)
MTVGRDQKLATLVPESRIRIAAFFKPEDAVGRVKVGQAAILRVDNFPWTQYGTVNAHVVRVGSEPREGTVRVELEVSEPNPAIPVVYGLTAVSDIQVERVTPLQLLLRTLGKHLTTENSTPKTAASAGVSGR